MDRLSIDEMPQRPKFNILVICTGNVCRSPLTEALLRKALAGLPVSIFSAGTHALVGEPMQVRNQRIAADLGLSEVSAHRAKQVSREDIRTADLILALDREHRREIVELLPRQSRRTFTLREFARLATHVINDESKASSGQSEVSLLGATVEAAAQLRGSLPLLDNPEEDDVVDPYRKSDEVYQESARQLIPAINAISTLLIGSITGVTS